MAGAALPFTIPNHNLSTLLVAPPGVGWVVPRPIHSGCKGTHECVTWPCTLPQVLNVAKQAHEKTIAYACHHLRYACGFVLFQGVVVALCIPWEAQCTRF